MTRVLSSLSIRQDDTSLPMKDNIHLCETLDSDALVFDHSTIRTAQRRLEFVPPLNTNSLRKCWFKSKCTHCLSAHAYTLAFFQCAFDRFHICTIYFLGRSSLYMHARVYTCTCSIFQLFPHIARRPGLVLGCRQSSIVLTLSANKR